jgi:hypothetical protein
MDMCRNPKLWIALAVVAAIVVLTGPNLGALLPVLLIAACPLSMLLMAGGMAGMARRGRDDTGDVDDGEVARLRAEVAELRDNADR